MKERLKKVTMDAFEDIFLPAFMLTWGIGLGVGSIIVVLSVLWEMFSFF